jgi:hypothetical protein
MICILIGLFGCRYTGKFFPDHPSHVQPDAGKSFEPVRSSGELIDGCDAFIVQTVPGSKGQTNASDGTFPALLVVVWHGLNLLLSVHRRKHTDPSGADAYIIPASAGSNGLAIILFRSALRWCFIPESFYCRIAVSTRCT